jgi:hypothetical protein
MMQGNDVADDSDLRSTQSASEYDLEHSPAYQQAWSAIVSTDEDGSTSPYQDQPVSWH